MVRSICLHGPESTGKSTLAAALGAHFGCEVTREYGRAYCVERGVDVTMDELIHIAELQDSLNRAAADAASDLVIFDTDALVTTVWADTMFGRHDPWFDRFDNFADLYLLLDIDLPFVDDGLRVYGGDEERRAFFARSRDELERRGVRWALVSGKGDARLQSALAAIRDAGLAGQAALG